MIVRARVVTRFAAGGYAPRETQHIENFSVDSAMDTDADVFTVAIGDPYHELSEVLNRNNEVRITLFASGDGTLMNLHTGYCDEITLNENNVLQFSGRDLSAIAVDSQHPYGSYRLVRPHVFVGDEIRELKMAASLQLANVPAFNKFNVDGSESYWEVWYRLYRKRQMWIWVDADGTVHANRLNLSTTPKYVFGETDNTIRVERVEWRSNKKQRIWEAYVYGHRGDLGFVSVPPGRDTSISEWIKKPVLRLTSSTARSAAQAREEALEEIFESQIGATEIKVLIQNKGIFIQQNNMAQVNLPSVDLKGNFYVVGVRSLGSSEDGLIQEIRLREKEFALSKRVPDPPVIGEGGVVETPRETDQFGPGGVAVGVGKVSGVRWKYHFVEAANKYHGPWPFNLFLGVLLAICDHESGFQNVRFGGSGNEYPGSVGHVPSIVTEPVAFRKFASEFANEKRYGRVNQDYAVGPMQLYSVAPKEFADKLGGNDPDELAGGRWEPRWNIISAAAWVRVKLREVEGAIRAGNAYDIIWQGLVGYTGGDPWPNNRFVQDYKRLYDSKYKVGVEEAIQDTPSRMSPTPGAKGIVENIFKWWDVLVANEPRVHYNNTIRPTIPLAQKQNPPRFPMILDCSGAVEYTNWLGGGKPLDNGGHKGNSYTGSQIKYGKEISAGQIDIYASGGYLVLVFYSSPDHVVACKSAREVYSHGQESGPSKYTTINYRTPTSIRAYEVK